MPILTFKELEFLQEINKNGAEGLADSLRQVHDEMLYFSNWDILEDQKRLLYDLKIVFEALEKLGGTGD